MSAASVRFFPSKNRTSYNNYETYYQRKRQIALSTSTAKFEFKNSIKIVNSTNDYVLSSRSIFEALKSLIGNDIRNATSIAQYNDSKTFIITFNETFQATSILGSTIKIDGRFFTIIHANTPATPKIVTLTATLRIHWLPAELKLETIKSYFSELITPKLEVLECTQERFREEDMAYLHNGVVRIKLKYNIKDHENLLNLLGIVKINGHRALIQLVGYPPKCLLCNKFGHVKKECPNLVKKCSKCSISGHNDDECTLARRTAVQIDSQANDEDIEPYESNTADTVSSKHIQSELISKNSTQFTQLTQSSSQYQNGNTDPPNEKDSSSSNLKSLSQIDDDSPNLSETDCSVSNEVPINKTKRVRPSHSLNDESSSSPTVKKSNNIESSDITTSSELYEESDESLNKAAEYMESDLPIKSQMKKYIYKNYNKFLFYFFTCFHFSLLYILLIILNILSIILHCPLFSFHFFYLYKS